MNVWPDADEVHKLKREWTAKYVVVDDAQPELKRFSGQVGRVVTVNTNGKALVQFDKWDWRCDISVAFLRQVEKPEPAPPQRPAAGKDAKAKTPETPVADKSG